MKKAGTKKKIKIRRWIIGMLLGVGFLAMEFPGILLVREKDSILLFWDCLSCTDIYFVVGYICAACCFMPAGHLGGNSPFLKNNL